ncbi:MAG: hypothetical protein LW884_00385 [Bacteroidetes bacterium]|nr:hypothetical protein [Bacteroidota bacterium]
MKKLFPLYVLGSLLIVGGLAQAQVTFYYTETYCTPPPPPPCRPTVVYYSPPPVYYSPPPCCAHPQQVYHHVHEQHSYHAPHVYGRPSGYGHVHKQAQPYSAPAQPPTPARRTVHYTTTPPVGSPAGTASQAPTPAPGRNNQRTVAVARTR